MKPTFELLQLQEFKGMRYVLKNYKNVAQSPDCNSSNHSQDGSSTITGSYFIRYAERGTPFDSRLDETIIDEDILVTGDEASGYFSEDSDEESEELRRDYVDEYADDNAHRHKKEKHNTKAPILTNTTLTVLRQMGKYLQMSRLMRPIAYNIITRMNELFDFYLYAVHSFFTSDLVSKPVVGM